MFALSSVDSLDACNPITLNHRMVVDKTATKVLHDNDLDDEPLSTWIQQVQPPVDGSGKLIIYM